MKKIIATLCLLLAVSLTASAQNSQLTLRKGDYRMDGNLVVTNDSILQRIRSERFDAIRLETPHNGFKLLKSRYWRGPSDEPADCDGTFVVEKDGSVSNVRVKAPLFPDCDKEAVRGVMAMPKWKPGKNNGRPTRCYYQVPVTFRQ